MSVYKSKKSRFYLFDFQLNGRRFHGSTGETARQRAQAIEALEREKAAALVKGEKDAATAPMSLNRACGRWYLEVGQHHAAPETVQKNLARLIAFFGANKLLSEITDSDVAELVTWRRTQKVKDRKTIAGRPAPAIAPATVNRSTLEPLQKIFNRAQRVWKLTLRDAPDFKKHLLAEPQERVREVRAAEEAKLERLDPDYRAVLDFARASGLRQQNCLLRKSDVDLAGGYIHTIGKGGKIISKPITTEMRAILMAAMANPTDHVFTYAAKRAKRGAGARARGQRLPITQSGLKTFWRRAQAAGLLPPDLRFHDLRHDFATKLLRETGNLRLVQRALDHSNIETTTKYAHVLDEEVLAGMEAAAQQRRRNKP